MGPSATRRPSHRPSPTPASGSIRWASGSPTVTGCPATPPSPSTSTTRRRRSRSIRPSPSLTWAVGDAIAFSGHATDHTGAALPASALTWTLLIHHCTAVGSCHIHDIQTFVGASGSFSAPDHPYPSYLELQLTATDSAGRNATASVALQPKTVDLTMASVPSGLSLIVSGNDPVTDAVHHDRDRQLGTVLDRSRDPDRRLDHICLQRLVGRGCCHAWDRRR